MIAIETVPVGEIHHILGFREPVTVPAAWRGTPLTEWSMVADGHLLRHIFRNVRPMRHLEFGTWRGDSVLRCVEECDATVWTINLLEGESRAGGGWAYGERARPEWESARNWSQRDGPRETEGVRTDAYGMIGINYLRAGWGKRVCQIYADSRDWDTRAYPDGFFDTVLVDGGHTAAVVEADTRNALRLVRRDGLIMWHDFCPHEDVMRACESTRDVHQVIATHLEELTAPLKRLFWIEPSWLLVGVRA
jgi:predicted O-methyltransferase YrrM